MKEVSVAFIQRLTNLIPHLVVRDKRRTVKFVATFSAVGDGLFVS